MKKVEFLALASAPLNMQSLFVINFKASPGGGDGFLLAGELLSWRRPGLTPPSPPPPPPPLLRELDVEVAAAVAAVAYKGEAEVADEDVTEEPSDIPVR